VSDLPYNAPVIALFVLSFQLLAYYISPLFYVELINMSAYEIIEFYRILIDFMSLPFKGYKFDW